MENILLFTVQKGTQISFLQYAQDMKDVDGWGGG